MISPACCMGKGMKQFCKSQYNTESECFSLADKNTVRPVKGMEIMLI